MKALAPQAQTVVGTDFDAALEILQSRLDDVKRGVAAVLMIEFPDRDALSVRAQKLREDLGVDSVEVNVITAEHQVTIVAAPRGTHAELRANREDSLCVLVVGTDQPLFVSDTLHDKLTEDHAAADLWAAWASAPVHVTGCPAGAVCALKAEPRVWTPEEEQIIQDAADDIGAMISEWVERAHRVGHL